MHETYDYTTLAAKPHGELCMSRKLAEEPLYKTTGRGACSQPSKVSQVGVGAFMMQREQVSPNNGKKSRRRREGGFIPSW